MGQNGFRRVDLHTHSRHSDGTSDPAEVVRRSRELGVELLVLTDHDSVSGFAEAAQAGRALGLEVRCGVEINTREHDALHILGYGFDPASPRLLSLLEEFRARRQRRAGAILERLKAAGLDLGWEDVRQVARETVGRPHVADAMIRKGLVRSRKEAFERYLLRGRAGYVEPLGPTPEEAIAAVREAGGWACLAHPGALEDGARIEALAAGGLEGVEAYYPTHSRETVERLLELAGRHKLLPTAGSDFHGPGTGRDSAGGFEVAPELYARLVERL